MPKVIQVSLRARLRSQFISSGCWNNCLSEFFVSYFVVEDPRQDGN